MSRATRIDLTTRHRVRDLLVRVERQPSVTDAYFLEKGKFEVSTSNGQSFCEGPVWILWDSGGAPYPITPEEFDALYKRVE